MSDPIIGRYADCPPRRVLGAVIRRALGQMRAKLSDDEQRMADYVREVFEAEVRG